MFRFMDYAFSFPGADKKKYLVSVFIWVSPAHPNSSKFKLILLGCWWLQSMLGNYATGIWMKIRSVGLEEPIRTGYLISLLALSGSSGNWKVRNMVSIIKTFLRFLILLELYRVLPLGALCPKLFRDCHFISQKQMRDIESITTKLTKEVNSVKDIVQETWQSKVYPAMPLKHRADEVC